MSVRQGTCYLLLCYEVRQVLLVEMHFTQEGIETMKGESLRMRFRRVITGGDIHGL